MQERQQPLTQDPQRLWRARVAAGKSQQQLAAEAKVSTSHMSAIEKGQKAASPDVLRRLAEALGCEIADLMPAEPVAR